MLGVLAVDHDMMKASLHLLMCSGGFGGGVKAETKVTAAELYWRTHLALLVASYFQLNKQFEWWANLCA